MAEGAALFRPTIYYKNNGFGRTKMQISDGCHAFITGGASGMGLGMAEALARRGVAVTIADIDAAGIETVLAGRAGRFFGLVLDVRDRAGWASAKALAEQKFGPVDILINNAGIGPDGKEFAELDPTSFDRLMAIDVTGVLNGISAFAADMCKRGRGHIVNNSSMVGLASGIAGMGPYTAAKAAVVAMSEILRLELAPDGVGVSVLCPGPVATRFTQNTARESGAAPARKFADVERMDVATVGECVIRGIEQDEPYIATHPEFLAGIEARMARIKESFLRQPRM